MTHSITLTRLIDAPRERVFDAWTDAGSLTQWWGPRGFTTTTQAIDVRPDGVWQFTMHGPNGATYPNYMTFETIDRPARLTYFHGDDANGPRDLHTTVTFDDEGGRTRLTMRVEFAKDEQYHEALSYGAPQSGHTTIDKLAEFVAAAEGQSTVVITRLFNAPVAAVWRAWTEPEQFMRWWGPKAYTSPDARIDLRVGGRIVNVMRSPEGQEFWGTGVYREIVPMERLVFTDSFADPEGNPVPAAYYGFPDEFPLEMLVTVALEGLPDGRTRLTLTHAGLPAGEHFEGTRQGWSESLDKLAAAVGA